MNKSKKKNANGMRKTRAELSRSLTKLQKNKKSNQTIVTTKQIPIAYTTTVRQVAPKIVGGKDGDIVITHTEYIGDFVTKGTVNDTNGFIVSKFPVNPGLRQLFPWLSQVAVNYETFNFHSFEFIFIPNNNVIQKGSLLVVADFDASDRAPESKLDFLNMKGAKSSGVYTKLTYTPQHKDYNARKVYNIRFEEALEPNQDIKLYDPFNLFVGYIGTNGGTILGEFRVKYSVTLKIPTMTLGRTLVQRIESLSTSAQYYLGNTFGEINPLGNNFLQTFTGLLQAAGISYGLSPDIGKGPKILLWSSKLISKVLEVVISTATLGLARLQTRLLSYIPPSTNFNSGEIIWNGSDDINPILSYIKLCNNGIEPSSINGFNDVSASFVKTWYNYNYQYIDTLPQYRRHLHQGLSMGPGTLIEIGFDSGSGLSDVVMNSCDFLLTDSRVENGNILPLNYS